MSDSNFSTTASAVIERWGSSLAGKTVVITGASTGTLGGATATALATSNPKPGPAHLLLALNETKQQNVRFVPISLDDFDSVRAAARIIKETVEKVDILINNAGVMAIPWNMNKDGIERQFAINHLGHLLCFCRLFKRLNRAEWSIFRDGKTYNPLSAYAQSKTANILFTLALAEQYATYEVLAFAVHPGLIPSTSLTSHFDDSLSASEMNKVSLENTGLPFAPDEPKTLEQGISTTLVAALSPELEGYNGCYLADCQVKEVRGHARDSGLAGRLWGLSEGLVGEKFEA
ncbi:uncharacterized protein BDV17DRAFT_297432 [Aspergillus undulatus]|uniref:uncharacterized protein n=1 Tax=Aspergillus undulatus TaxID=1810928 RepID=UPI003CCD1CA0